VIRVIDRGEIFYSDKMNCDRQAKTNERNLPALVIIALFLFYFCARISFCLSFVREFRDTTYFVLVKETNLNNLEKLDLVK
jgi:hypothetical protein